MPTQPRAARKTLARYRRVLEEKAQEMRKGLSAERAAEFVHLPDEPLDLGDWCQKSHDQWFFVNQNRREVELLREVEAALRRCESGAFGVCQRCGEVIVPARLEAIPWAAYCVRCEQKAAAAAML